MLKRLITRLTVILCLFIGQAALAETGSLFTLTASGEATTQPVTIELCLNGLGPLSCETFSVNFYTLTIGTTEPNFLYTEVGIKILTSGYALNSALNGLTCIPNSNGYCIFQASDTLSKTLSFVTVPSYTLGGSISNLNYNGLVIQNGNQTLAIPAGSTSFQFANQYNALSTYSVSINTQPVGAVCTLAQNNGTFTQNITSVVITCANTNYTVGGTTSGLSSGTVTLIDNDTTEQLTISANGSFQFINPYLYNSSYNVSILTQPTTGINCLVESGEGVVNGNVSSITVNCSNTLYTVSGTITGLSSAGLTLENTVNGSPSSSTTVTSPYTSFSFSQAVLYGDEYVVSVTTNPSGFVCSVDENASGTITGNVTNVGVNCSSSDVTLSGSYTSSPTPLPSNVTLINNGDVSDSVTLQGGTSSGNFIFPNTIPLGGYYDVTVSPLPTGFTCTVDNGQGGPVTGDVTIQVTCDTTSYTIGGSISNPLAASGIILTNNGDTANQIEVSSDATAFEFPVPVAAGASYNVTVTAPSGYYCSLSNASGTATTDVTNIVLSCSIASPLYSYYVTSTTVSILLANYSTGAIINPDFIQSSTQTLGPNIATDTHNQVYVPVQSSGGFFTEINQYNGLTGALITADLFTSEGFPPPQGHTVGQIAFMNDKFYIVYPLQTLQSGTFNYIYRYNYIYSTNTLTNQTLLLQTLAGLRPIGLTVDSLNNLYTLIDDGSVTQYSDGTTTQNFISGLSGATDVAITADGTKLYVSNGSGNYVNLYTIDPTQSPPTITGSSTPIPNLPTPSFLAVDSTGNLYISNQQSDSSSAYEISQYTATGTLNQGFILPSTPSVLGGIAIASPTS